MKRALVITLLAAQAHAAGALVHLSKHVGTDAFAEALADKLADALTKAGASTQTLAASRAQESTAGFSAPKYCAVDCLAELARAVKAPVVGLDVERRGKAVKLRVDAVGADGSTLGSATFDTTVAAWAKLSFTAFGAGLARKLPPPAVVVAEPAPRAPDPVPQPAPAPRPAPSPAEKPPAVTTSVEPAATLPPAEKPQLLFVGVRAGLGVTADEAAAVSSFVQSQLDDVGRYKIISSADLATLLGIERQRQLLGCSDESSNCMTELAGALNADRLVTGDYSKVEGTFVLNLSMLDPRKASAIARVSRSEADASRLLDEAVGAVYDLANRDPLNEGRPVAPERGFGGFFLGVRADADVLGLASGPAVAPCVTLELSGKRFGGALTLIAKALPGFRLEGRLYPFQAWRVRPYLAAGGIAFTTAVGVRGGAGLAVRLGHVQLFADGAYERFLYRAVGTAVQSVVVGLGAGWAF